MRERPRPQKFFQEARQRTAVPGVATGLAVTGVGGDVLFVEATAMKGTNGLVLTGQLGDVMKESARIALYVRGQAEELGIDAQAFDDREFHVHVPAGAIPKDGPSAGVTMTTALASLLSGRPVKHTVGMTGEVTLQGRVLPIGGLKQKVLAAHAAGLTDVVLPERNRGDLDDVPEDVREQMAFHPVMTIGEVLDVALEPATAPAAPLSGLATLSPPPADRAGGGGRAFQPGEAHMPTATYRAPSRSQPRARRRARPGSGPGPRKARCGPRTAARISVLAGADSQPKRLGLGEGGDAAAVGVALGHPHDPLEGLAHAPRRRSRGAAPAAARVGPATRAPGTPLTARHRRTFEPLAALHRRTWHDRVGERVRGGRGTPPSPRDARGASRRCAR